MVYTVPIPPMSDMQLYSFWSKVEPTGFCWTWSARTDKHGYGHFNFGDGRTLQAHRIAYTLLVGEIPKGLVIDHLCRNTSCVNPDHLEPVTHKENQLRIPEVVRRPSWITSGKNITGYCKHGHEYTVENTYTYKDGRTDCRTCKASRKRKPQQLSAA